MMCLRLRAVFIMRLKWNIAKIEYVNAESQCGACENPIIWLKIVEYRAKALYCAKKKIVSESKVKVRRKETQMKLKQKKSKSNKSTRALHDSTQCWLVFFSFIFGTPRMCDTMWEREKQKKRNIFEPNKFRLVLLFLRIVCIAVRIRMYYMFCFHTIITNFPRRIPS